MGDMSGYTLTFTGMETAPAEFVVPNTIAATTWSFTGGDVTIDPGA